MSWLSIVFFDAEPWPMEPEVATHLARGGFITGMARGGFLSGPSAIEKSILGFENIQNPQLNIGDIVFMNGQPQGVVESIDFANRTAAIRQMSRGEMHKRGI